MYHKWLNQLIFLQNNFISRKYTAVIPYKGLDISMICCTLFFVRVMIVVLSVAANP